MLLSRTAFIGKIKRVDTHKALGTATECVTRWGFARDGAFKHLPSRLGVISLAKLVL